LNLRHEPPQRRFHHIYQKLQPFKHFLTFQVHNGPLKHYLKLDDPSAIVFDQMYSVLPHDENYNDLQEIGTIEQVAGYNEFVSYMRQHKDTFDPTHDPGKTTRLKNIQQEQEECQT
jgi:hypothetical protein